MEPTDPKPGDGVAREEARQVGRALAREFADDRRTRGLGLTCTEPELADLLALAYQLGRDRLLPLVVAAVALA